MAKSTKDRLINRLLQVAAMALQKMLNRLLNRGF